MRQRSTVKAEGRIGVPAEVHCHASEAEQARALAALDKAMQAVAEASTPEEAKTVRDQLNLARMYVQRARKGFEIQFRVAEMVLRAERKVGQLLRDLHLHGGDRRSKLHRAHLKLGELGIDRTQSARWQLEASVPESEFEHWLCACKDGRRPPTSAGLLRLAKTQSDFPDRGSIIKASSGLLSVRQQLEELVSKGQTFPCILANPPWPQLEDSARPFAPGRRDAVCAFTRQLRRLPVGKVAAKTGHLHLYAPADWLGVAIGVLSSWGFTYRSVFVLWGKQGNYGPYWRIRCGLLLLGVRGYVPFRDTGIRNWAEADGTMSSGLAESIMDMIERVSPSPRLALLGPRAREGWTVLEAG